MIEPVQLENFFITFFSAALVVTAGALYALLFAWAKLQRRPRLMRWAYAAYAVLLLSLLVLARVTHLTGIWYGLVGLLALGYGLAPHGIWQLCVGTHAAPASNPSTDKKRSSS